MYVCMYVCMYACKHVCMCVYAYVYVYVYVFVYVYVYVYVFVYIYIYVYVYVYVYIHIYVYRAPQIGEDSSCLLPSKISGAWTFKTHQLVAEQRSLTLRLVDPPVQGPDLTVDYQNHGVWRFLL